MLCVVGMAACSNPAPSVPASPTGSADASRAPIASGPSAIGAAASGLTFGSFNACALLPASALAKIVGGEAHVAPMLAAGWVAGQCAWSSPTSGFFVSVGTASSIQKASDPAAPNAKAKLAEFRQRLSGTKEVPGIGDGAVLGLTGMAAYQADTYVEVTELKLTDDQLIEIVKLAVANL